MHIRAAMGGKNHLNPLKRTNSIQPGDKEPQNLDQYSFYMYHLKSVDKT